MYPNRMRALRPALAVLLAIAATNAASASRRTLCVHGIEPPNSLKVHSGPGGDSAVLGSFPAKACDVKLAGRCEGNWCQMSLGRSFGWVDTRHIGVYELPDGARIATARAAPKAAFDPASENADEAAKAPTASREPPAGGIVVEKVPVPKTVRPIARPQPIARAASVTRPPAVVRPGPRIAPRPHVARLEPRRSWSWAPVINFFATPRVVEAERSSCVVDVARWDTLRIRSGPGVHHREIGEIPPRACGIVEIGGGCYGSWCRVAWRGQHGWVNTRYLE